MTTSKQERVYRAVRKRIVDGTLPPGSRLVADALARELNVSPVPVREALRRLEAEGFVDYELNVGARVRTLDEGSWSETLEAIADARRRLAEVPASVVVTNHAMGLFELAAIHLSAEPTRLAEAALAIDALGLLVDGLGERLGEHHETLVAALGNIRLVFVQKSSPSE